MRILYFSQYFPPEVGATQTRAFEMARYLVSRGHHVTMVTEVPNHPSGIIPPKYRGKALDRKREAEIDVLRLWVWASPEKSFSGRMRFYLSYMAMAGVAGSLLKGKYDLAYATSPPLFVGATGLAAAIVRRIPFVFEVRDLWPESAVALGELGNRRAIRAAEMLERLFYRRATRIVTVTRGIKERLVERGFPEGKIALIPNGANVSHFKFDADGAARVKAELGLENQFIVMYAGIHGVAQGLETLLGAADLLRDRDDMAFVLIGEGPRKAQLRQTAAKMGLERVYLLPEVPSAEMPAYLSAAGCAIVPLRKEPLFEGALPSKMFEAWACSRPVVLAVKGEATEVLMEAGGGLIAEPEDSESFAAAITALAGDQDAADAMGISGRKYVERNYARREQARALESLLLEVVGAAG